MNGFLPRRHLSDGSLRRRCRLLTTALLVTGLTGCEPATPQQQQALRAGRDAVVPCQERFHEESQTYADCVRYVAQQALGDPAVRDWRRLGALYTGWVRADLVGQQGDAPADRAARTLLAEALGLQQRLGARDGLLCELVERPCVALDERRRELQAPPGGA